MGSIPGQGTKIPCAVVRTNGGKKKRHSLKFPGQEVQMAEASIKEAGAIQDRLAYVPGLWTWGPQGALSIDWRGPRWLQKRLCDDSVEERLGLGGINSIRAVTRLLVELIWEMLWSRWKVAADPGEEWGERLQEVFSTKAFSRIGIWKKTGLGHWVTWHFRGRSKPS